MNRIMYRTTALVIIILASLLCLPWLDRPFSSRGEPREALVAQAMIETGNWISPPAYDGAVPSKPPFCHWLMSIASTPLGRVTEATCRLPSAIAFILFMYGFYTFVARRTSRERATMAALILLTSFEWIKAASSCRVDTILATSMAGALLALYQWEERGRRGFPLLVIGLIAVATLTKGPVGLVLPLSIWGTFCILQELSSTKRTSIWAALYTVSLYGMLIALPVICIAALWYVAGYYERGDEFLSKVWYENFERFTSTMEDEPHKHSVFYLLGMLLLGFMPWSVLWCVSCVVERALLWRYLCTLRQRWMGIGELSRFAAVAAVLIVLFFCIPSSKRSVYLLPAYPFVALIAAASLQAWAERRERAFQVLTKAVTVLSIVPLVIAGVLWGLAGQFGIPDLRESMTAALSWEKLFVILVALALLRWPLREQVRELMHTPVGRFSLSLSVSVLSLNIFVIDGVTHQLSPKRWLASSEFVSSINHRSPERFYSYGSEMYAASFYLKKPFSRLVAPVPPQSLIVLEARKRDGLYAQFEIRGRELSRFDPAINRKRGELVVIEVESSRQNK